MTAFLDQGAAREQELRDDALEEHAIHAGLRGKTFSDSATLCRVCDEKIPMERRKAVPGVQTCISCQEELELATKTGRTIT